MTPTLGRGANTAMRDGALLGRRLKEVAFGKDTLRDSLAAYEHDMLGYGFNVVREAASAGNSAWHRTHSRRRQVRGGRTFHAIWCASTRKAVARQALAIHVTAARDASRQFLIPLIVLTSSVSICTESTITSPSRALRSDRSPRAWRKSFCGRNRPIGIPQMRSAPSGIRPPSEPPPPRFDRDRPPTRPRLPGDHVAGVCVLGRSSIAGYETAQGLHSLREAIAAQISATRAISCNAQDIVVTSGAQQAFDLLARLLIVRPGAPAAFENPGYPKLRDAFSAAGAGVLPIEVDADGMRVDQLPNHVRVVTVTPSHEFPLGSQLSLERRQQLLQFARTNDAVIIEDDYDGEFCFRGRSLDALKTMDTEERVFYIGTFSKTLLPGLRIGYIIAPRWARTALSFAKQTADVQSSSLHQEVIAAFISDGHMIRHLARMRGVYQGKCAELAKSIERHCGPLVRAFTPAAGMHLTGLLPAHVDSRKLAVRCRERGVAINTFADCWTNTARWPMIGLGLGPVKSEDIDTGIRLIAEILRETLAW